MARDRTAFGIFALVAIFLGAIGIVGFAGAWIYYGTKKDETTQKPVTVPTWVYVFLGISILVFILGMFSWIFSRRKQKKMALAKIRETTTTEDLLV